MKKVIVTLLVLLLLAGGVTWYFVTYRMDAMIQQQIETAGARSLGAQVSVGAVETNLKDGSMTISSVTVANPPGFKNPNAFSLNGIEAAVDYGSREIRRVVIDNPEIIIEELGGKTNFSMMMDQLERTGSTPAPAEPGSEEPVIVIHHFRMNESRAAFESEALDTYANIKIDAVELNDLRGTPTELGKVIANKILKEISQEAATEMLKAQARKQLGDAEKKVSEKLKDIFGKDNPDSSN
ncbi:MAG: hypothetical protein HKN57_14955 [Xanthomonadales bacterium]|nr:hypothetical protein [Gammaproteobacteria bacterium]MBT8054751.1 hypothetical protein [Gammaproteobacteria bacterium]NND58544.1 hypothetical protein [Xanthomonadales bacterium]NNK52238.1 hypothetical protein [Xanthomonadales bacterium]